MVSFHLKAYSPSSRRVRAGSQGRYLEAGTEVKALGERYLADSLDLLPLPPYTTWDHLPRAGTAHNRLGLPTSIIN